MALWNICTIEERTKEILEDSLGKAPGEEVYGIYSTTRKYILEDYLDEIKRLEGGLTDHGPNHINDVLNNAHDLIDDDYNKFNAIELYCLIMAILFHDVGNVYGRDDHNKTISPVYDMVRPTVGTRIEGEEKSVLLNICASHTGVAPDGTNNTLKFVSERARIFNNGIKPIKLAPIIRFADELAEGQQRTSYFLLKEGYLNNDVLYFHKYSEITNIDIDKRNERIRLTYNICIVENDYREDNPDDNTVFTINELKDFLPIIFSRIEKLNQERQYNKHFCDILVKFKRMSVTFNFWYHGLEVPTDLNQVELDDLVVPGDLHMSFIEYDESYKPANVIKELNNAIKMLP